MHLSNFYVGGGGSGGGGGGGGVAVGVLAVEMSVMTLTEQVNSSGNASNLYW